MKALVLAGGAPQIALIHELKSRNIFTILADYNENPVARSHADVFYRVSTLDVEAIREVAEKERVDFLITVCTDQALLTVAQVSEQLGLPCYIDYQTALRVTNKAYMKQVFAEKGIPTAKHVVMRKLDVTELKEFSYPLMVKPADCNSSKGVKKVTDEAGLKRAFEDAITFSRTGTAVIEEFIDGPELSVDVYVQEGKAKVLSVSKLEKMADEGKFLIFRGMHPATEAEEAAEAIRTVAQGIAEAFDLKNTPMLIQMIVRDGHIYVLEFSARTGGGVKYRFIRKVSNVDVIGAVVDLTLGIKPEIVPNVSRKRYVVNEFVYCLPGEFHHLEGFEEAMREGLISDYDVYKSPGMKVGAAESSGDRAAGYTVEATTWEELERKHSALGERLKVIDSNGANIIRRDYITALSR